MFYRPRDADHGLRHNPFKALVAPRPIGWVSSRDAEGRANLAPFSYFNAFGDAPPLLGLAFNGVKDADGARKDTLSNIEATGVFAVNLVSAALGDAMNATSGRYPAELDEFEHAGLEKAPCREIDVPRVAASPAAFECRLWRVISLPAWGPEHRADLAIGEVVGVHIDPAVIADGRVDVTRYRPLARLGYRDYAAIDAVFQLTRPE
ncbi:MAG: flavin reductase family protein [Pseudomonadota bacterium]